MIVRSMEDLRAQGRYREKPGVWSSARYLLRPDGVGFTLTQTSISAGSKQVMEYKNHIEANLIIEGEGMVTDCSSGQKYPLKPGVMYTLDKHDRRLQGSACVFQASDGRRCHELSIVQLR